MADNAMRLSQVLRQFASEAPWIQLEMQRTSAQLYSRIEQQLMAQARESRGRELTEAEREAVREVARSCTPSFAVPSMNATVRLELAKVTRRGWLLRKATSSERTDFSIDLAMQAAPVSPIVADPGLVPASPEELESTSDLAQDEVQECKRLMAGTAAAGDKPGQRVEQVAAFLSDAQSDWEDIWDGSDQSYRRLTQNVENPDWSDDYRNAMRAILRRVLLIEGLTQSGNGMRMRDWVRGLHQPPLLFLDHLRAMKYAQDEQMLGA